MTVIASQGYPTKIFEVTPDRDLDDPASLAAAELGLASPRSQKLR
jgi:hypothetical protein